MADRRSFVALMNTMLTGDPTTPVEYLDDKNIQYNIATVTTAEQSEAVQN
jgi:glutaredoxin-related protein